MKIDVSKFQKIDCDDKCTTLQHPNGHQIKIAHKGLSAEMKKELDALPMHLAKGGRAKFAQKFDPNMKKAAKPSEPSKSTNTMPGSPTQAKNSFTEPQALGTNVSSLIHNPEYQAWLKAPKDKEPVPEGGDAILNALHRQGPPMGALSPAQHYPPCINPSCKSYGRSHPNCRCYGGNEHVMANFSEGGEVDSFCSQDRPHQDDCEYYAGGGRVSDREIKKQREDRDSAPQLPTGTTENFSQKGKQTPVGKMTREKNLAEYKKLPGPKIQGLAEGGGAGMSVNVTPQDMQDNAQESVPVQGEPMGAQPASQPEIPQAEQTPAPTEPGLNTMSVTDPVQQGMDHAQQVNNHLMTEDKAVQSDINAGHIQPKTYHDLFAEKGTLGKIGTIFGLMMGGAGSGLTGEPNMLLEMMDKTIQRDLESQKDSANNRMNLLKVNQQALANQANVNLTEAQKNNIALSTTYMQQNRFALDHLVKVTQSMPPGPQRQQAEQTLAILSTMVDKKNATIASQAAMASALSSQANPQGGGAPDTTVMKSGMIGPEMQEMGKDIEDKTLPGVPGRAARPIPQENRNEIQAMNTLDAKSQDLLSFIKQHRGSLNPQQKQVAAQKAEEMVNYYNASIKGGVLTQGRLEWLDKQISKNPLSIVNDLMGNSARLNEIKTSNSTRKNILLQQLGFPPQKGAQAQPSSQGSEIERMTPGGKVAVFGPDKKFLRFK